MEQEGFRHRKSSYSTNVWHQEQLWGWKEGWSCDLTAVYDSVWYCSSTYNRGSQTFYDLVPLGHPVLSTRTTSSGTANL